MDKDIQLNDTKKLKRKAMAKYLSKNLSAKLAFLNSDLKKSYWNTYYCNDELQKNEDGTVTGRYCKNRWCFVCNRIKIANMINKYESEIAKFKDPYFVTMTAETVDAKGLRERICKMGDVWRSIVKNGRKKGMKINGIRKLECTIRPNGKYHPHFHLIVDGKVNSEAIIRGWLRRWEGLAHPAAQDMRPADKKSSVELFKYFTKLITKKKPPNLLNPKPSIYVFYLNELDVIFRAMKGRRVYQSFGNVHPVDEDDTEEKRKLKTSVGEVGSIFKWVDVDWFETQTGKPLTGFMPNEALKNIVYK